MGSFSRAAQKASLAIAVALLSAAFFAILWPAGQAAAAYRIVKLVDKGNRPDLPCCTPFYIFYTPVISGERVAFLSRNGPPDGVWSGNINTRTVRKLAGLTTPAPNGVGNFSEFFGGGDTSSLKLTIGGGFVAFFAKDAEGTLGLYVVSVNGGAIKRIVTTKTTAPDGQPYTNLANASLNGPTVVFWGKTSLHEGVYRATRTGTDLRRVIDNERRLDARSPSGTSTDYFGSYGNPVIGSGNHIVFAAGGLFDPVSGANALFRPKTGAFENIADNMTRLDGHPYSHNRIQQLSADVRSDGIAFRADQPNNGFVGVFKARSKTIADAFVTNQDVAPGTGRKFSAFSGFGYDESGLAFTGLRTLGGGTEQNVYFVERPGGPIVRVASGQQFFFPVVGDRSISNGRIVFMEQSNFADTVFVAVPTEP